MPCLPLGTRLVYQKISSNDQRGCNKNIIVSQSEKNAFVYIISGYLVLLLLLLLDLT